MTFICDICKVQFTLKRNLVRHIKVKHDQSVTGIKCTYCERAFTRKDKLREHLKTHEKEHPCTICEKRFRELSHLTAHLITHSNRDLGAPSTSNTTSDADFAITSGVRGFTTKTALKGNVQEHTLICQDGECDLQSCIDCSLDQMMDLLQCQFTQKGSIKWYFAAKVRFAKVNDTTITSTGWFRSKNVVTLIPDDIRLQLLNGFIEALHALAQYQKMGSYWVVDQVICLNINIVPYTPLAGCSYIKLPPYLANKKAIINVKNEDELCFAYAVLASILPKKCNSDRVNYYMEHLSELDLTGLTFPMKVTQIPKFERQNHISVNVFGYQKERKEDQLFPVFISDFESERTADLMLISEGELTHYTSIQNLSSLMRGRTSNQQFCCRRCLHFFSSKQRLVNHKTLCSAHSPQKIEMPDEESKWMQFKNMHHQIAVPYTVYADFECILPKVDSCQQNPESSSSTPTSRHETCGFAYVIVKSNGQLRAPPTTYRGRDAAKVFLQHMVEVEREIGGNYDYL